MEYIDNIKNGDSVDFNIFGKILSAPVYSYGDSSLDENGNRKTSNFELMFEEVEYINFFRSELDLFDLRDKIELSLKDYARFSDYEITFEDILEMDFVNVTTCVSKKEYVDIPDICFDFISKTNPNINIGIGFRLKEFFCCGPIDIIVD